MRAWRWALFGLAAYAAFLVALIPASFIAARVAEATAGRVAIANASGTLWRGRASASLAPATGPALALDTLEWRFLPSRLASGRLGYAVRFASPALAGTLELARGFTDWEKRDINARAEAGMVAKLLPIAPTWQPGGTFMLTAPRLTWDGRELAGDALIEWHDAATSLSELHPLGSYRAVVQGMGGPAKIAVSTISGPLQVIGQGALDFPTRASFSGEARAQGASAAALEPLLALMGARRPDGAYAIDWRFP